MNTASEKPKADWEAIEREYRAGQLSVSEIGRIYGISHTAINKKAKKEGWTRNLAEKVREEVSARLVSDGVSAKSARETVELAAERQVQIVREHRQDISSGRRIVKGLFDELQEASDNRGEIEADIEAETEDDKNPKRRSAMLKAVSLGARASTALSLSSALKNLVGLERQAFGMPDRPEAPADEAEKIIAASDGDRARALAAFLAKTKVQG